MHLWSAFTEAASSDLHDAYAENEGHGAIIKQADATEAEALIVLPDWPYKASSNKKNKKITIVIHVVERMDETLSVITKCNTQIGYYDIEKKKTLLEMHYDFDSPVSEAHPIFHAQLGRTRFPLDRVRKYVELAPDTTMDSVLYGNARIPTAFMGFPQILTMVAADHLTPRSYRRVVLSAKEARTTLPVAACGEFGRHIEAKQFPHAHEWYEDRYIAALQQGPKKGLWTASISALDVSVVGKDRPSTVNMLLSEAKLKADQIVFLGGS